LDIWYWNYWRYFFFWML